MEYRLLADEESDNSRETSPDNSIFETSNTPSETTTPKVDVGSVGKTVPDSAMFSDATLTVLSNKNNPIVEVRFSDIYPVSLANGTSSLVPSGETNVLFEGNDTLGARLSLQNNIPSGTSVNQIDFCDAGGQSTSSIIGYNTDQTNNYGVITFGTRNAQGTPPGERVRITTAGQLLINRTSPNDDEMFSVFTVVVKVFPSRLGSIEVVIE